MVQGFEQRDVVNDPNNTAGQQPANPGRVPMSPVMAPQPSSFAKVGDRERGLAKLLEKSGARLDKLITKKKAEWEVAGQMAYMEGKTEADIVQQGNRYTTAGYMTMKARTAANEWKQQALADIANSDHKLSSKEYQSKLSQQFSSMMDSVAGGDEYTRQYLTELAKEDFPQLVGVQLDANNKYMEEETYRSRGTMLLSTARLPDATDEKLGELLDIQNSGLPDAKAKESNADILAAELELGSDRLMNVFGKTPLSLRNNNPGNIRGRDGKFRKFGTMQEGLQAMRDDLTVKVTGKSNAMKAKFGEGYQPTLANVISAWAPPHENDTNNYVNYVASKAGLSPDHVMTKEDVDKIIPAMTQMEGGNSTLTRVVDTMLKQGYAPADVQKVQNAAERYAAKKTSEFSEERIKQENDIEIKAGTDGNLDAALNQIRQVMEEKGYTDSWANSMADKAQRAVAEYNKKFAEDNKLTAHRTSGTLSKLSGADGQKALDALREKIFSELSASEELLPGGMRRPVTQDVYDFRVMDEVIGAAHLNGLVDKVSSATISSALSGQLLDSSGKVTDDASKSYQQLLKLRSQYGDVYASRYLNQESAKIVSFIDTYTTGGMGTDTAIKAAAARLATIQANPKVGLQRVDATKVKLAAADYVNDVIAPNWLNTAGDIYNLLVPKSVQRDDYTALNTLQIRDYELQQSKDNPKLLAMFQAKADFYLQDAPELGVDAALKRAAHSIFSTAEFIAGEIVTTPEGTPTLRERMGIGDAKGANVPAAALYSYVADFGPDIWKDQDVYNKFTMLNMKDASLKKTGAATVLGAGVGFVVGGVLGPFGSAAGVGLGGSGGAALQLASFDTTMASIADKIRGVPALHVQLDTQRNGFLVDLYADKERTQLLGQPKFIPLRRVGNHYRKIKESN